MEIKTKLNIGDEVWVEKWHPTSPLADSVDGEMENYRKSRYAAKKIEAILYHQPGFIIYQFQDWDRMIAEDEINVSKKQTVLRDIDQRINVMQKSIGILCKVREKIAAIKEGKV